MPIAAATTVLDHDLPDERLVELARQGQGAAYAQIMRRNNRRLFRLVRSIVGSDHEAEEVVQETYVRAYTALDGWRGEATLATWLSRIALNEALGEVRRRRQTVPFEAVADAEPVRGSAFDHLVKPSPEQDAARGEIRHLLERAIDSLPAEFRSVFVLRAVERLSVDETAAVLGVGAITVRTRFFRARKLLRSALGEQFALALGDSFPFAGARCDRIIERVLVLTGIADGEASVPRPHP